MIDITPIINAALALLAAVVTVFLVPWLKQKAGEAKWNELMRVVEIAVTAAEEYFGAGKGADKFNYVVELLEKQGYSFDDVEVRALIDSTVWELINQYKEGAA